MSLMSAIKHPLLLMVGPTTSPSFVEQQHCELHNVAVPISDTSYVFPGQLGYITRENLRIS